MNAWYFALGAWCGAVTVCILFIRGANPPEQVGQRRECEQ